MRNLGDLVDKSTPQELAVYDELIARRPEFGYHIGLSRAFWGTEVGFNAAAIQLKQRDANQFDIQARSQSTLRSGLGWLTALARIELSASLSAYTEVENPFGHFPTRSFDQQQYELLLFDDALNHLVSLSHDPDFKQVAQPNRRADASSMDYLRRTKLVRDMVQAARNTSLNNSYADRSWEQGYDEIEKQVAQLRMSIHSSLQASHFETTSVSDYERVRACGVMLQAERNGQIRSRQRVPQESNGR